MSTEIWNITSEIWSTTLELWTGAAPVLEEIQGTGLDYYDAYKNLSEKKKKKIIRLVLFMNNIKIKDEKEVKDYNVTVKDIDLVMEMYKDYKQDKKIIINDVILR